MNDKKERKGVQTRKLIIEKGLKKAVTDGLDAITLGPIAKDLNLSKSGLYAHFQSREDLQVAIISEAVLRFEQIVISPSMALPSGMQRLRSLFNMHLKWMKGEHEAGGCVFVIANQEYSGRAGLINDLLVKVHREWRSALQLCIRDAKQRNEIPQDVDQELVVFRLIGIALAFNTTCRLLNDENAEKLAQRSFETLFAK